MQLYWDLTEAERAALTRDDVAKFVDAELMTKGVLKPTPLVLLPVPEANVSKETFFRIEAPGSYGSRGAFGDLAFRSEADASAVIAMRPVEVSHEYDLGNTQIAKTLRDASISMVSLPTEESAVAARATLKEATAAKAENDRRRAAFDQQSRKVEEALKGLWEDWHACVERDAEMKRVAATFREYIEITRGDHATASAFLAKAFPTSKITDAEKWTSTRMTYGDAVAAAAVRVDDQAPVL